jgi:outer membrane protein assembly factor BamB
VFLTTADEQAKAQSVLAFDFQTGQKLWETIVHRGEFTGIHPKNSHASATPCGDGQRVFAAFLHGEELFVTALDLAGQQLWQTSAGPFHSEHGLGASPALHGAVVIVSGDSRGSAWLAGLHRETGEIVWRTPRAPSTDHGNYASPIVATLAGRPQLLMAGFNHVRGYHPDSGEELWQADGPTHVMGNTLAVSDPWVIAS